MIFLVMAVYFGLGLSGMLVSLISLLGGFHGDADVDHDLELDHDYDFDHDIDFDHDVALDHDLEIDADHDGGLGGWLSLTVISLAVSIFGFAGLFTTAVLSIFAGPIPALPGFEWTTGVIALVSVGGALPASVVAWYLGAKFYQLLKRQETPSVSGLRNAVGYDAVVDAVSLVPDSLGKISIKLPSGEVMTGFARLADGYDKPIPIGSRVRIMEVTGDTAIVTPEIDILGELESGE